MDIISMNVKAGGKPGYSQQRSNSSHYANKSNIVRTEFTANIEMGGKNYVCFIKK